MRPPIVVIGRFQPFHFGHLEMVVEAAKNTDRVVIIIGSANESGTKKNPWDDRVRRYMIEDTLIDLDPTFELFDKVKITTANDMPGNNEGWKKQIVTRALEAIQGYECCRECGHETRENHYDGPILLGGYKKDASSFYLDLFPEWWRFEHPHTINLNATDVRQDFFTGASDEELRKSVPQRVLEYLRYFNSTFEEVSKLYQENK